MMRWTKWALLGGLLMVSVPARAQDAATKARAAELNREAAEHARRGEWDVSSALLAQAYRLTRDASLLVNLAATELKAGKAVDALHHLQAYLADPAADPKVKNAVTTQLLPRAMAATGHLTIHFPAGGRLTVDGEAVEVDKGAAVAPVDVMPGDHTIEVSASGSTFREAVAAKAGASMEVQAIPTAAPAAAIAPAPVAPPVAPQGQEPEVQQPTASFWTARHIVPLALLAGGVAAAGTGAGFLLGANSAASQASSCGIGCSTYASLRSTYEQDSGLATGLFIGAGVLAAGAVVTWLAWPGPHRGEKVAGATGATVMPYATPAGAGLYGQF